jgi:uncharacterized membrane protein YeaQ/YmgE (transglycosylase-associated protein family)
MLATLGFIYGAAGQVLRLVVGLKKLQAQKDHSQGTIWDVINVKRLVISIIIGGVAGVLAALAINKNFELSTEQAFGIVSAGYAGADFLEGFITSHKIGDTMTKSAIHSQIKPGGVAGINTVVEDTTLPDNPEIHQSSNRVIG